LGVSTGRRKDEPGHSPEEYAKFKDLIERMLQYNPVKRLNAVETLNHLFLRKYPTTNNTNEDSMGNTIRNQRYVDPQNNSRLSFAADNANVEELTNIQRRVEVDDLPDEMGNPVLHSNALMQPIGYYNASQNYAISSKTAPVPVQATYAVPNIAQLSEQGFYGMSLGDSSPKAPQFGAIGRPVLTAQQKKVGPKTSTDTGENPTNGADSTASTEQTTQV